MANENLLALRAIAWKNVSRKPFRNAVVALAVGLLVALLVFALLFNRSVKEDLDRTTRKLGADIVLVPPQALHLAEDFLLESKEKTFYMTESVYEKVKDLPEIDKATYQIYLARIESGCCSIVEGQVVVFDQKTDFVVTPWLTEKSKKQLGEREVFVGSYVAEYLGLLNTLTLFGKELKMVGELQYTGIGLDHGLFVRTEDLDITSPGIAGQYQQGKISIVFLKLKNNVDLEAFSQQLVKIIPNVGIMTRANIGGGVRSALKDITKIFTITIAISSILAILLAWSTFTALANERQREVGIMRAIGARRYHIMKLFILEAVIVSGFGGLVGVVAGNGLIWFLAKDFQLLSRMMKIPLASPMTMGISIFSLVAGVVVCLVGAMLPVSRLAHMEPLGAIKSE